MQIVFPINSDLVSSVKSMFLYFHDIKTPTRTIRVRDKGKVVELKRESREVIKDGSNYQKIEEKIFTLCFFKKPDTPLHLDETDSLDFIELCKIAKELLDRDDFLPDDKREIILKICSHFLSENKNIMPI